MDVVSPEKRSQMMAGIRSKDTKPEIIIRKALHARGFRYRLHSKNIPGKPDLVLKKYNAVIFIHGCFWHRHDCHLFKWPSTRKEFWKKKIEGNVERDRKNRKLLQEQGWRIATIWECALKGKTKLDPDVFVDRLSEWILSGGDSITIEGRTSS